MTSFVYIKIIAAFLATALLLTSSAFGLFEQGVKEPGQEDVVLVGGGDWYSAIASTPLAIYSSGNSSVIKPQLILPRDVKAGDRIGWIEQDDIDRYGVLNSLHTLEEGNISAVVIHGSGDLVKSMAEAARKEGIKAYVTATLEVDGNSQTETGLDSLANSSEPEISNMIRDALRGSLQKERLADSTVLQRWNSGAGLKSRDSDGYRSINAQLADSTGVPEGTSVSIDGQSGDRLCPVDPEVREVLYNKIEELISDYEIDGVVLYNIGFSDERYCFCDVCKEQFYRDTGLDLGGIESSDYNYQRWLAWREEKVLEIVREARNITSELGPVSLGVAVQSPTDRSEGYNFGQISKLADFMIISPVPEADMELASGLSSCPVYVRLSDSYVEYSLSTQNVEGAVKYIEGLVSGGAAGLAFEYNVVYTPLWDELQPPSGSARWLIEHVGGKTLGIGDVFWNCSSRIRANDSYALAKAISERWASSPGVVIVGDNYTAGLAAAPFASYLNWPVLFVGDSVPNETSSAIKRLKARDVVIFGPVSAEVKERLADLNMTIHAGSSELLISEMKERGDNPEMVVLTNSHDLSLISPRPNTEYKREVVGDVLIKVETSPTQIPSEKSDQIVRMNITLSNLGSEKLKSLSLVDSFPSGRYIRWPGSVTGILNITDPGTKAPSTPIDAFFNGSLLFWEVGDLEPDGSVSLVLEVEILHPLDAGWTQPIDRGLTVNYDGLEENVTVAEKDDPPITNITYPSNMPVGTAYVDWEVSGSPSYTALNLISPEDQISQVLITDCEPGKTYRAALPLAYPGIWQFNIESGDWMTHTTEDYEIDVKSSMWSNNVTAFSHTKVPKLSMTAASIAAGRKGIVIDVAEDPQDMEPAKVEEYLNDQVASMDLLPRYLVVVGDPGSMPFPQTGLRQDLSSYEYYDVYREYRLDLDDDNYTEVGSGRIVGLSVYDASQMVARNLVYPRLRGSWESNALVISNPAAWPWSPNPLRIRDYLDEAGLDVRDLRWEEATYQKVASSMNNGMNIVHFDHHGVEYAWGLSYWSMMDSALDETQVKQLVLAPQTTTTNACLTSRLKGFAINVTGTDMYIPMRLDNSIALAFIRAGAVNYIGANVDSWIFVSDDHAKRLYQALVYENATIGMALAKAENLYLMKMAGAESIAPYEDLDEPLPEWQYSMKEMMNQTSSEYMLFGDPSLRPYIPTTPEIPYRTELLAEQNTNSSGLSEVAITPTADLGTDWLYWVEVETTDGEIRLNAPPVLIGEVMLPKDADEVVVKEGGRAVWHEEDVIGDQMRVMWPVVRPRLNESRTFTIEYRIVPGDIQTINVSAGWNMVSLYLEPKDASIEKYFKKMPYRGIFSISDGDWDFSMKDLAGGNVTVLEPGVGYLIDSQDNFTVQIPGKPVELPYRLKLHEGWNMIGVPINRTMAPANITVNSEHRIYSFSEAISKGLVSAFMWSYAGDGEWIHIGQNDTMEPGKAYMIEVGSECRLEFE